MFETGSAALDLLCGPRSSRYRYRASRRAT